MTQGHKQMLNLVNKIASELKLQDFQVNNVIKLLFEDECTIPFVARYRKEMTEALDEVVLRSIRDRYTYLQELETNKEKYLKVVEDHCSKKPELKKKWPELKAKFEACQTKQQLEDLYLPFKPKRRTRAQVAKEKGLEPLLRKILEQHSTAAALDDLAKEFVTPDEAETPPNLRVKDVRSALTGASDILAEEIAETAEYRALAREVSQRSGKLISKKIDTESSPAIAPTGNQKKKKTDASKYENYFDFEEAVSSIVSHRIMALRRGEAEKVLKVTIDVDSDSIIEDINNKAITRGSTPAVGEWIKGAVQDAWKRLLSPAIETELRLLLKSNAEKEAINVFSQNLEKLLLLPPIPKKIVLGVDPGIRTGSKLAVVDNTSKFLDHCTIYPDPQGKPTPKTIQAKAVILDMIKKHAIQYIAIGNGTGSREISKLISELLKENELKDIKRLVVNESGASVYSTDDIAREEFPELDATIRSAISIARRLQDPLAELVKIDPRSIGVGQYQHDVNVTKLNKSLGEVVESCVNRVGVNVNTASYSLLSYVSGINKSLARNIVSHRDKNGQFASRQNLQEVSGFGPKAFEQAAGFLRVPDSQNPLDNSSVHPERYEIVQQMAVSQNAGLADMIGNKTAVDAISLEQFVSEAIGMPTLVDITAELIKPGRDPREDGNRLTYSDSVSEIEDLEKDMILPGTVTNVTNFGAFVDIGVHQDGLVHISELADKFVDDPTKVISVGDVIKVRILEVDQKRRRISLSRKLVNQKQVNDKRADKVPAKGNLSQNSKRGPLRPRQSAGRGSKNREAPKNYTVEDLMAKFSAGKR